MKIVQGWVSVSFVLVEATPHLQFPTWHCLFLISPLKTHSRNFLISVLATSFNFSVSDFIQLLRSCINMILSGHDFLELGHPMLASYLDNIERIMLAKFSKKRKKKRTNNVSRKLASTRITFHREIHILELRKAKT